MTTGIPSGLGPLPPFAALKAFEAVGRLGGIRKAAQSLGLDHAVVSRHIRQLEEWLGTPILTRSANRLALTDTGSLYHARISAALNDVARATRELLDQEDNRQLRLWCVPGFAARWLSDQIAEFERRHPEYPVEMRPTDEPANLLIHEADVDIRYYGDDWPPAPGGQGLKHVELARPKVIAVASPQVARRVSELGSAADLMNVPLLHEEHHDQWRAWLRHNGVLATGKLPGPLLWHAHLALAAARQGRGVALANSYLARDDLARGELVEVRIPGTRGRVIGSYILVAREDRWSVPAVAALRQFLRAIIR